MLIADLDIEVEPTMPVLKAHEVRYFFYIGGNDSSDTVRIVNENANQAGYESVVADTEYARQSVAALVAKSRIIGGWPSSGIRGRTCRPGCR